eukprot:TRINITY_DN3908_c1_g1_i1.p1 TRINITY_DN3908_c1_g1~~TRINITY_DN3908_c1_g1_i1.p1  ORF type:complete len:850 (+),score=134.33 TRINITY_DN3908_c1_g1_i1:113-2662(+)
MPYGGGSGVVVQQPTDVNTLFNDQTIDQLWETLSEKRKECELMQTHLRQLVGDRYKDLLSASDMIVGMGDICDYLTEDFEQTNAKRLQETTKAHHSATTDHITKDMVVSELPEAMQFVTSATYQIQSWLAEGRYLEAALCCKEAKIPLQKVINLCVSTNSQSSYLYKQACKSQNIINTTPNKIIAHSTDTLAKTQLTANTDITRLVGICCKTLCCIALLDETDLLESLKKLVKYQDSRLRELATSAVDQSEAISCVSRLYTFRCFIYKVFVEHSVGLKDFIELTSIVILNSEMENCKPIMDLSQYLSSSEYFDSENLDLLPDELPAISDVKLLLSRWESDTANIVSSILEQSLSRLGSVEQVTKVQDQITALSALWNDEPLHAQPPAAWLRKFQELFANRMAVLFKEELVIFEDSLSSLENCEINEYQIAEIQEISLADEKSLAQRYKIGRTSKESRFDPSLPRPVTGFLSSFEQMFLKITNSIELLAGATTQNNVSYSEFTNSLQNISNKIEAHVTQNPTPKLGLLIQGISRIISQVVSRRPSQEAVWKANSGALTMFHERLHETYMKCFDGWTTGVADMFCGSMKALLESEYWGPDKEVFDQVIYSSWEHREEIVDDSTININLPGSVTPGVLEALHQTSSHISANLPSLLRSDVIANLHLKMSKVFSLYAAFLSQNAQSICQPALWQLLFDVRFIAVVCKSEDTSSYKELITVLMNPETGVDPVYWSTERSLFEEILSSAISSSCLLLAVHGVKRLGKDKGGFTRDASYADFIPECPSRFVTYHLASLQQNPATSSGLSSVSTHFAGSSAATGSQSQSSPTTLSGLQHLKALGTGLQNLKGTYFKW